MIYAWYKECKSNYRGCHGHDRMVVGSTTTYASSAHHHWCCEFESRSRRGIQHYVIRFVSDWRQVGGFLRFPPSIKFTATITEILLKVALNTTKQTKVIPIFSTQILNFCLHLEDVSYRNLFFIVSHSMLFSIVTTLVLWPQAVKYKTFFFHWEISVLDRYLCHKMNIFSCEHFKYIWKMTSKIYTHLNKV
jgi:hypothetical protein